MELNNIFLIGLPGGWEWILIVLAVLLLFGGKKIPELARGLGKGISEFKNAKNSIVKEMEGKPEDFKRPEKV